jgi:hypothetical protein
MYKHQLRFNRIKQTFEIETNYNHIISELELLGCLEDTIGSELINSVREIKNETN